MPAEPAFFPGNEERAAEWLADAATPGDVVLSSFEVGNRLPTIAPVRVVIGHGPESAELANLKPQVAAFFSSMAEGQRQAFLADLEIRFVFVGPIERTLGEWDPARADFLLHRYASEEYDIYEVR
jgi:hypothetical protein